MDYLIQWKQFTECRFCVRKEKSQLCMHKSCFYKCLFACKYVFSEGTYSRYLYTQGFCWKRMYFTCVKILYDLFFLYMKAKKVHISALYLSIRKDFDKAIVSSIILDFFSNNRTSKEDFCTIKLNKIERLLFYWIELSKSIATKELPLLFMQLLGNVSHFYFPFSFLIE